MIRFQMAFAATTLILICGCGGTIAEKQGASKSEAPLTVPEQSEPEPLDNVTAGADAFTALVKAATENDAAGWAKAEKELQALGRDAAEALSAHLSDPDRTSRELAAMCLAQLGPDAAVAAKGLANLLEDESTFARVNAAAALSTFDGYVEQTAPVLKELLADEDANVRTTAATALRNVGPLAKPAIKSLTALLKDEDANVRIAATETLGALGPDAQQSLNALRALAKDLNHEVAVAARRAIRKIDESEPEETAVTIPASATE